MSCPVISCVHHLCMSSVTHEIDNIGFKAGTFSKCIYAFVKTSGNQHIFFSLLFFSIFTGLNCNFLSGTYTFNCTLKLKLIYVEKYIQCSVFRMNAVQYL